MRAKIVKIGKKLVTIKKDDGDFVTVNSSRLGFDYGLGDTIIIEQNGEEMYYLPFHNTTQAERRQEYVEVESSGTDIASLVCSIIGLFCLPFVFVSFILYMCSRTKNSSSARAASLINVISIILWFFCLIMIASLIYS